jgi:hypothetical protein
MRRIITALLLAIAPAAAATAAQDAPPPPLRIELNRLEPRDEGCRLWLILGNPGAEALDPLRLDLVLFGRDGVVARRLAVEAGPLPAEKTSARVLDLGGTLCEAIGGVLLNDLLTCGPPPEGRAACLARSAVSSRVPGVAFQK